MCQVVGRKQVIVLQKPSQVKTLNGENDFLQYIPLMLQPPKKYQLRQFGFIGNTHTHTNEHISNKIKPHQSEIDGNKLIKPSAGKVVKESE